MTNKRYNYEKIFTTSNENDIQDIYQLSNNNNFSLENENNIYSEMPIPTEMYYISQNNDDDDDRKNNYNQKSFTILNNNNHNNNNNNNEEIQLFDIEKKKLQDDINKYFYQYNSLYYKLQEKFIDLTNKNINQQNKIDSQEKLINQLRYKLQNLEKEKNKLDNENNNLYQKNLNLENQIKIFQQNDSLVINSNTTIIQSEGGDDDQNYIVNLNNNISELNDKIRKYITNLKQDIVINMKQVKNLLSLYKCPIKTLNQKDDRLLIQAVLQRHIIEKIFDYAKQYFQSTGKHYHLEADIIKSESSLSLLLTHASKCRVGNDEVTLTASTKLRQQIYSILNNRGFSDIVGDAIYEHPFIAYYKEQLNDIMNELRIIEDIQKKSASENLAATIIRDVIKIFWFRLKVQEPAVQYLWIQNNTKVDKTFMEGNNLDDNGNLNLFVDLCYFPLIGRNLSSNNRKIYFPAKVYVNPTTN
ncbi:uncharacterized protein OCT59_009909 [Rhizophagus irregularis]|uniref:Uncharacterized protein n=1 Tax=Rhizophagus irregularis (strain DAOM 197198w) TaxID=1432141 RepID=A0A015LXH6_RHIIW|nr:hypothetical protein RirG_189730 [Rhizophagus irregularis DAOM 197198w]UZO18597.1 hypothetical protein OCT59_009909 [Rhizophagus irregularis]CAG8626877.1 14242_t:CDS:1 [Rhizophagus irregularis]